MGNGFENLDRLTEKIYQDGISKAQIEADKRIEYAKAEAKKILANAKQKAEGLIDSAKREAKELISSTESELQLKARRVIDDSKRAIEKELLKYIVKEPLESSFNNSEFYERLIKDLLQSPDLKKGTVTLPESREEELKSFMNKEISSRLEGLSCNFSSDFDKGFTIKLDEKNYYLSFTYEDFVQYFKEQLTSRTEEIVFKQ